MTCKYFITCNASIQSKGFCHYKCTNGIERHLAVDTLGFPFFKHCSKASTADDQGLVKLLSQNLDYFRAKPVNIAKLRTDRAGFHGLGWNVGYTNQGLVQLSHSGAFDLGAATTVYLLPSEALGIVVLTNSRPIGVPEAIALSFLDLVQTGKVERNYTSLLKQAFASLDKPPYGTSVDYSKPPAQSSPALPTNTYAGTFRNNFFSEIAITVKDGKLVLQQGPKQAAFPLQHYSHDVFTYQPVGENAYGLSGVTFTIGADGKANSVVVENLNIHGQGRFTRVPDKQ